jgi:hypothetical protein
MGRAMPFVSPLGLFPSPLAPYAPGAFPAPIGVTPVA